MATCLIYSVFVEVIRFPVCIIMKKNEMHNQNICLMMSEGWDLRAWVCLMRERKRECVWMWLSVYICVCKREIEREFVCECACLCICNCACVYVFVCVWERVCVCVKCKKIVHVMIAIVSSHVTWQRCWHRIYHATELLFFALSHFLSKSQLQEMQMHVSSE